MIARICGSKLTGVLATLLLLLSGTSIAQADQVNLSYIGANGDPQTLDVDANSPPVDLALVAALLGENGVAASHDPINGSGTLADIGAAMAAVAPAFAPTIAQALSRLVPDDTDAIVAAINAVPGINTEAVLAAVHFGPPRDSTGPQSVVAGSTGVDFGGGIDVNPSRN